MFTNLPSHERTAFFSLLDEYFTSRPQYLPSAGGATSAAAAPASAPPGGVTLTASDLQKVGRIGRGLVAGAAQAQGGAPPAPPARGTAPAAATGGGASGLTTNKAFGKISTASASAALGSVLGSRGKQAAPAASPAPSPLPPPRSGGVALPPPSRTAAASSTPAQAAPQPAAPQPAADEGLGWAKAIYDYTGTSSSDLSVAEGEEIYLVKTLPGGEWYEARSSDGQREGMVPCNYVERI